MAGAAEAGPPPARWRRRAVAAALLVLVAAVAVRVLLTVYAAELFVAALGRALAGSGAEVVFAEPPSVTAEGFESKGVILRSRGGDEWVRAETASGSAHLFLREPYISVALTLKGARTAWSPAQGNGKANEGKAVFAASLPASISSIDLEDARIDFGSGNAMSLDGAIYAEAGASTRIEIARLDYTEPSGERAVEKIAGVLSLSAPAIAGGGPRLDVSIRKGAALSGTVLVDFTSHPLTLAGTWGDGDGGALRLGDLTFALGRLLRGSGSVTLEDGTIAAADVTLASDDLAPAFATLVREPFSGTVPALVDSDVQGRGEMRLEMSSPSRHRVDTTVRLTLKSLRTRSVEAETVTVDLPWIGALVRGRAPRTGNLRAGLLSLLGVPWTGVDVPLEASAGKLRARSTQEWKTAGGTLRMSGLVFEDDGSRGPRLSGNVELAGFDLARLGPMLGIENLTGSLHGDLGRVQMDGDAVRAEGAVDIEAFGGSLRLSHLFIEQPFSRVPALGLDVAAREIDLAAFTRTFGFGRVNGVLEGDVTGLVIADGQPQAFDADLHTVERRGVSQNIDVKAIVQLGVLGGDTGSLTGSLLRVVDRYRYSAMGIRCRLRNDVFEIRGVESRGGKDYLVKGSLLPPSVSVVSHSQVISFSEMLRRIERITTIEEGGSPDAQPQ